MITIEEKLKELSIVLPEAVEPVPNYVTVIRVHDMVYTSGSSCFVKGKPAFVGKVCKDLTVEQGYEAARITALNLISVLKSEIGDLDLVERIVKVVGFVNSAPGFVQQTSVIDGASDTFVKIFGDKGKHTRCALGTSVLPFEIPVEIEMTVLLRESK